jgi:hypothetical protein
MNRFTIRGRGAPEPGAPDVAGPDGPVPPVPVAVGLAFPVAPGAEEPEPVDPEPGAVDPRAGAELDARAPFTCEGDWLEQPPRTVRLALIRSAVRVARMPRTIGQL